MVNAAPPAAATSIAAPKPARGNRTATAAASSAAPAIGSARKRSARVLADREEDLQHRQERHEEEGRAGGDQPPAAPEDHRGEQREQRQRPEQHAPVGEPRREQRGRVVLERQRVRPHRDARVLEQEQEALRDPGAEPEVLEHRGSRHQADPRERAPARDEREPERAAHDDRLDQALSGHRRSEEGNQEAEHEPLLLRSRRERRADRRRHGAPERRGPRRQRRQSSEKSVIRHSARPETQHTASVRAGCTANRSPATSAARTAASRPQEGRTSLRASIATSAAESPARSRLVAWKIHGRASVPIPSPTACIGTSRSLSHASRRSESVVTGR